MKKSGRKIITVEGAGQFPYDMMRYDECWPRSENDSHKINMDWGGEKRQVELLTVSDRQTPDRWDSFNWKILHVRLLV